MKPEEKARVRIDRQLEEAGWKVVSRDEFTASLSAAAVKEGLMKGGLEADLMGHESIETTRIYLRRTATEQRQIVDEVVTW